MSLNVIMMGPPGVGKGTQAEIFGRTFVVPRISTGDILREAVQANTELGRAAKVTMDAGRLVSDDVMIAIVRERLEQPDARAGFVLDGFPRTVPQATALDRIVEGRGPLIVLNIEVPEEELVRRVHARRICAACGFTAAAPNGRDQAECQRCGGPLVPRSDDGEETVRERLKVYARDTQPIVDYYRQRPTFRTIDGNQPPDRVTADVRAAVDALSAQLGWNRAADRVGQRS